MTLFETGKSQDWNTLVLHCLNLEDTATSNCENTAERRVYLHRLNTNLGLAAPTHPDSSLVDFLRPTFFSVEMRAEMDDDQVQAPRAPAEPHDLA